MRRGSGREGVSFGHASRPHGWWGVAIVALVAATGCTSAVLPRAEPVDLSPLLAVHTDASVGLSSAFPDYEAVVVGGVQQWNGQTRSDGVVDLVKETYDSELDASHSWFVDVTVTLFDSPERATRVLDSSCHSFARGGASGYPVRWQDGVYCASSVVHRRTDPLNLYLPTNFFSSWVFVRRDRVVMRLYERHEGTTKSAKNAIIVELAERLSKFPPAPRID
jgi:hypothetical protein